MRDENAIIRGVSASRGVALHPLPNAWTWLDLGRHTISLVRSVVSFRLHAGPSTLIGDIRTCVCTWPARVCPLLTLLQCHSGRLHMSLSWTSSDHIIRKAKVGRRGRLTHGELGHIRGSLTCLYHTLRARVWSSHRSIHCDGCNVCI
jgi:hypothetical protein